MVCVAFHLPSVAVALMYLQFFLCGNCMEIDLGEAWWTSSDDSAPPWLLILNCPASSIGLLTP